MSVTAGLVSTLQDRLVVLRAAYNEDAISPEDWDAGVRAWLKVSPHVPPSRAAINADIEMTLKGILMPYGRLPTQGQIDYANLTQSRWQTHLNAFRPFLPGDARLTLDAEYAAQEERLADLAPLRDPADVGQEAFLDDVKTRAENLVPQLGIFAGKALLPLLLKFGFLAALALTGYFIFLKVIQKKAAA